jgi:hypothetical protein
VTILPFLGEDRLYKEFHLDEPWDSEHNGKLIERMPKVFATADAGPEQIREGLTTVQVLTGPGTVFASPSKETRVADVHDGMSYTLAIVEAMPENAVPWTKPADIPFNAKQPLAGVGNPRRQRGLFVAAFLDGHIQVIDPGVDPDVFEALVTPAGGEAVSLP